MGNPRSVTLFLEGCATNCSYGFPTIKEFILSFLYNTCKVFCLISNGSRLAIKNNQVLGCSLADQLFLKWVYLYACTLIKCWYNNIICTYILNTCFNDLLNRNSIEVSNVKNCVGRSWKPLKCLHSALNI